MLPGIPRLFFLKPYDNILRNVGYSLRSRKWRGYHCHHLYHHFCNVCNSFCFYSRIFFSIVKLYPKTIVKDTVLVFFLWVITDETLWYKLQSIHCKQALYSWMCENEHHTNQSRAGSLSDVAQGCDYWTSDWCLTRFVYFFQQRNILRNYLVVSSLNE